MNSTEMDPTELELAVLRLFLSENETLGKLLGGQLDYLSVKEREVLPTGFFTRFNVSNDATSAESSKRMVATGVNGEVDEVDDILFFILYIENGLIGTLECALSVGTWPLNNVVTNFSLFSDEDGVKIN